MERSDARKRLAERANTDTCQTPECGHAKSLHHNSMGACVRVNPRCGCTRYTAPTETGQGDDDGCWHDWKPLLLPVAHVMACADCGKYRDTAEQIHEQVVADADAAWETRCELTQANLTHPDHWPSERAAFIAGFLKGRGLND